MNETDRLAAIHRYIEEVAKQLATGQATEHSYRPALKSLLGDLDDSIEAINEPKQSEHGAPDFVVIGKKNKDIKLGYGEAKIPGENLDKIEKSEQMDRYKGYANLFLTDCLDWHFYRNGEKILEIKIGDVNRKDMQFSALYTENYARLADEIANFLNQTPEKIKSGKRLAEIMGGKARRIRDNVAIYLKEGGDRNTELEKIYEMMKKMLVHDLEPEKFADMYAQTLVYGLFVARYGDSTPDNFTRTEARDLVPKSNPFLRHFFDHIVGPSFDTRLGYIVDELCETFSVSNVQEIVHKHLRIQDTTSDAKDPIIHFYEDFLQEYDSTERKKMGAYYTPIPVVKYIVRQVDKILREDFGLSKGLASTDTVQYQVETGQDLRHDRRMKAPTHQTLTVPRVQVLDPAVGTATFLNETIKFIYEGFKGQEGRWPSYVNDNLLKRLHGFELMMAPYTIAHLKLGMTLKETGVENLQERLGVYLTNTLEEGVPQQPDLFSFGLAEAVSEESRLAAEVKSERPVMVVMGNPPYAAESSNKTKFADMLIDKYRVEPGGQARLQERNSKALIDDYVKFISFAENMIVKRGSGIVAMITNHGYLDNATFRGMRWRLIETFDKIDVLDLHGNAKKLEVTPDGGKDENVFDIMQGVSIIFAIKDGTKADGEMAIVKSADVYGLRRDKFSALDSDDIKWKSVSIDKQHFFLKNRDTTGQSAYNQGVSISDLLIVRSAGMASSRDSLVMDTNKSALINRIKDFLDSNTSDEEVKLKYNLAEPQGWTIKKARQNMSFFDLDKVIPVNYRPFDGYWTYFDSNVNSRMREKVMRNFINRDNLGLVTVRRVPNGKTAPYLFISDKPIVNGTIRSDSVSIDSILPLYTYHEDGTRTSNFNSAELSALTRQLTSGYEPEDIFDYIYAVLHSPSYREKYKEFLKIDFPRVPVPTQVEFDRLVPLGRELRKLHLMKSPGLDDYVTTFSVTGDNVVEKLRYEDEKVWINDTQYFGNVPEIAWNFYIGGYQPAQKWLKDRVFSKTNRPLANEDLDHYQRIIKTLLETDRIMKEIDSVH